MNRPASRWYSIVLILCLRTALAMLLVAATVPSRADELDEADIFFELNDTDGDLGIHCRLAPLAFTVDLPPNVTEVELPEGLTNPGDELKVEVLVKLVDGNSTAVEGCVIVQ